MTNTNGNSAYSHLNTLFNRVAILNVRIDKLKMKDVGQLLRKAYQEATGKAPEKIALSVQLTKHKTGIRNFAVYPVHFIPTMDLIITDYAKANKPKRKRIHQQRPRPIKTARPTKR